MKWNGNRNGNENGNIRSKLNENENDCVTHHSVTDGIWTTNSCHSTTWLTISVTITPYSRYIIREMSLYRWAHRSEKRKRSRSCKKATQCLCNRAGQDSFMVTLFFHTPSRRILNQDFSHSFIISFVNSRKTVTLLLLYCNIFLKNLILF